MRHTIEVTRRDIDQAMSKASSRCVVATAIARSIPTASRIDVDIQSIRFTVAGERFAYVTPYSVQGYIVSFDAGDEIEPFKFRLDEEKSINVRQTRKTDAGRATANAAKTATRKAKAAAAAQDKLTGLLDPTLPPPTPTEVKAAKAEAALKREQAKTAEESRAAVIAAYANQPKTTEDLSKPKPPPRVHKTSTRHYGHRELRINQG